MSEPITKPRVSAAAKTALVLAAAAVLLAVFALAAPGSKFFFPLVSLWCNLALFACVLLVLRVAGIKFDLFHKAVIHFMIIALLHNRHTSLRTFPSLPVALP